MKVIKGFKEQMAHWRYLALLRSGDLKITQRGVGPGPSWRPKTRKPVVKQSLTTEME